LVSYPEGLGLKLLLELSFFLKSDFSELKQALEKIVFIKFNEEATLKRHCFCLDMLIFRMEKVLIVITLSLIKLGEAFITV
jgi:hypothetical protein